MKKILFLSFNYPEGEYGPSTMCSVRVMEEMAQTKQFEVHCISYLEGKNNYDKNQQIITHFLSIKPKRKKYGKKIIHFRQFLMIPFFPFYHLISDFKHYLSCRKIVKEYHFDLVVSQFMSEQSLISGVLLKKRGYAAKHIVLFWDNIYGRFPRILPKFFVLKRQRFAENIIAKYSDLLISLYPIKSFHYEYGDVPNAYGKRKYLGIPSIIRPQKKEYSCYRNLLIDNRINVIYSGTIFKKDYVEYTMRLFNFSKYSHDYNMVFFSRSIAEEVYNKMNNSFKGSIQSPGFIPHSDLLSIYPLVDFFISYPGVVTAIRSKVFEYMSYGKPILLFYDDENDVNINTFSCYPSCLAIDMRFPADINKVKLDTFIENNRGSYVQFNIVEKLFPLDTASAYVDLINDI